MKVFYFEDSPVKQEWFYLVVQKVNELLDGDKIESGFGNDARSSVSCLENPNILFQALKEDNSIYLVDLDLGSSENRETRGALQKLLSENGEAWATNTIVKFRESDEFNELKRYPIATLILLAAKELGRPVLLVSSLGAAAHVDMIIQLGLASNNVSRTPNASPQEYPSDARINGLTSEEFITKWANQILALIGEYSPISRLRKSTLHWFSLKFDKWTSFEDHGLPHDFDLTEFSLENYGGYLKKTFDWLPRSCNWWKTEKEALSLHECLKSTLGDFAQWMGKTPIYPLPLGGAYFVFLYTLAQYFPNDVDRFLVEDWSIFTAPNKDGFPIPKVFLPPQEKDDANRSVQALYDFFLAIIQLKGKPQNLGVADHKFFPNYFRLEMDWSKPEKIECAKVMRTLVTDGFSNSMIMMPKAKTTGAFLRFIISSQVSKSGMGSCGVISLDEDGFLTIGSVQK
ncbi:MAG: hypothetical protein ACKN9W_05455 [Methylococcus sp.]